MTRRKYRPDHDDPVPDYDRDKVPAGFRGSYKQYRAWMQWQESQHKREQLPQFRKKLTLLDGSVVLARMSSIDGRALVRFITALRAGVTPEPVHTARVMRLWSEGTLTADEMDELWRLAATPERPFTEHDGIPHWDVILSGYETSRQRH